jgi:hypothetical protein
MKRLIIGALLVAVLAVAGYSAWRMMTPPPADLDLSRSKASANGLYQVSIAPELEPVERNKIHGWIVDVTTPAGEAVGDAEIAVGGGMPQHGHGLPTEPQLKAGAEPGKYLMEGVRFNMAGWWVLRLSISSPRGADVVEFNLNM